MRLAFPRADAALVAAPLATVFLAGCALIGPPADVVRDCARIEVLVQSGTQTTASTVDDGPTALASRMRELAETLTKEAATITDEKLRKAVLELAKSYRDTASATTPQRVPDAGQVRAAARRFDEICGA